MNRILGLYIPEPAAERSRGPADHDDRDRSAARRRRLESLAVWATALSPIVHIEGQDTLLVDVTGCQRLFAGEENLLRRAIQGLEENGRAPRGAIADTPGAAWAIAHADARPAVIAPPGRVVSYLAPLPVWSLRIDHAVAARLHAVGVMTIESLLHLPRSSLPARFGEQLGRRLDQALGNEPELLTPYRPRPVVASRLDFTAPTDRVDVLHEALRRALETFCRQLTRRTAGVCRMFVTLSCPDVPAAHGATADAAPANASSTGATPTSAPRTGAAAGADTRCVTRRVNFVLNLSRPTRSLDH
ncbi:MAG: DNA polymerase Y family protein, partial [Phycisphaerae bacterium]